MKVKVMLINRESFDLDIEPDMTVSETPKALRRVHYCCFCDVVSGPD